MTLVESIILGVIQGATEFFPVSSSGHLVLLQNFFRLQEQNLFFDTALHVATLFAILLYYFTDIVRILRSNRRYVLYIAAGTVPTAVIGFFGYKFVKSFYVGHDLWIGIFLIAVGVMILAGEKKAPAAGKGKEIDLRAALIIGTIQAVAIFPGISRSGVTIAAACMLGIKRDEAVRFSFLLAIPSILGAFILQLATESIIIYNGLGVASGCAAAFVCGILALKVLRHTVLSGAWRYFSFYCFIVGIGVVLWSVLF